MTKPKKPYRGSQYIGGCVPAKKCARGHKLTPANTVKAGKANNPRCKICRQRIYSESRKRKREAKAEERANG